MNKQKFLKSLELFSTVGFALAYFKYDIYVATGVLMFLLTALIVMTFLFKEPMNKLQFWSWIIVMLFGGATVFLKDEIYIKWKPTIINLGLSFVLIGSHMIGTKTICERLLDKHLKAPAQKLRILNFCAGIYTLFLASLNLIIAYNFDQSTWVNFKIFGLFALNMIFFIGAYAYLWPYIKDFISQKQQQ